MRHSASVTAAAIFVALAGAASAGTESVQLAPVGSLTMLGEKPYVNVVSSGDLPTEPRPSAIGHRPPRALLHRGFIGAGAILLTAAFGTDYIYCTTALWQWANFSAWLITSGLIVMGIAAIMLLIEFATKRAGRLKAGSFILVAGAAFLSLINAFVHSRDAWTSVVPQGILLSAVSTILLIIAGARGWSLATSRASGADK